MKSRPLLDPFSSKILFAAILVLVVKVNAAAQTWAQYDQGTPPQHAAGVSPVGSYLSTDLGTINLSNGALNLSLPMGTAGGRGFSIPISLNYSSKVWSVSHDSTYWEPPHDIYVDMAYARYAASDTYEDLFNRVAPSWVMSGTPLLKKQVVVIPGCQSYTLYTLDKLTVVLPDKGEIELRDDVSDGAPSYMGCTPNGNNRGRRWHATDGSGTIFTSDVDNGIVLGNFSGTLITGDGMRYRFTTLSALLGRADRVTDRNGNQININYSTDQNGKLTTEYVDQLGRSTKIELHAPDPANGSVMLPLLVTIKGYQGTPQYYKVKTDMLGNLIRADFNYNHQPIITGYNDHFGYCYQGGQPPAANYLFSGSYCENQEELQEQQLVSQVILPDGRSLQFGYNLYGEVAELTLPTGGKVQYDYTGFTLTGFPSGNTLGGEYQGGMNQVTNIDRAVTTRRTYPDGSTLEGTWTYAFGPQSYNGISYGCTEIKGYSGALIGGTLETDQRHFFLPAGRYLTGLNGNMYGTGYSLWSTGIEWRTEVLDAAGGVISASEQDWAQRAVVSWSSGYTQEQPANDNRTSQTRHYLDDGSFTKTDTFYDNVNYPRANNVSEVKEYDFDQTFKRLTRMTYKTGAYQTDDAIHLLRLVQQQSIYADSAGTNEVGRTVNEYDVYAGGGNAPLQDYGAVIGHDNSYGLNKSTRGNLTATGRWVKTNNTTIYSYLRYDTLGNPVSNKDANGNVTTLSYLDDFGDGSIPGAGSSGTFGATYALPTLITSPPPTPGAPVHTARSQYDFSSGQLTGFKDRNGIITQTIYNDPFSRPTLVKTALGISGVEAHAVMYYAPATAFGITLTNNDVLTAKDQNTPDDATLRSWTHTDGFGRTVETWTRDPSGDDKVLTVYDALGRVRQQSNPFRPSLGESAIYTTSVYDLAGRLTSITTPDSAVVNTYYRGNQVLVKDQMSKERMSKTNALGQLTDVWEITGADDSTEGVSFLNHPEVAAGYRTKYTYNTLGNLISVTQQKGTSGTTQTRTFVYDSLSQLTDATNPESGHIVYDYDANGNLLHKTDARPITTTYGYDALNRNTTVNYSNTTIGNPDVPDITRVYDGATNGKGRLWESYAGGTATVGNNVEHTKVTGYDPLGRPVDQLQEFKTNSVWSSQYTMHRVYNIAGQATSQIYPSVHAVAYVYDTAGRTNSFTGNLGEGGALRNYSTEILYSPLGGMTKEKFGTDTAIYNKLFYNSRGQLAEIREGTSYTGPTDTGWERGAIINYYSTCWGMCGGHNSTTPMTDNNGNLKKQEIFVPGASSWLQQYDYDNLNRLQRVHEYTGNQSLDWQQEYVFDRYGNRTIHQTNTWGAGINKKDFTANAANNNRLGVPAGQSGTMAYDAAGNLTTDTYSAAAVTRVYDAENRMTSETQAGSVVAGTYTYNADGQRVRRKVGSVETWQVYGFGGELLAEYAANAAPASPQKEYGYRSGQLLITAEPLTNVALAANGGTTLASSSLTGYPASKVNDGDRKGGDPKFWADANPGSFPDWVEVDFSGSKTTSEIDVVTLQDNLSNPIEPTLTQTFSSYGATAYNVQYWNGTAWTAVTGGNVTGNNKVWRQFTFTAITTTKIRVVVNAVQDGLYSRIVELEAWTAGQGSTSAKLNWLATDQLGTPRMIFDKTGSLAATKRHDYLPFGEEIFAGTGGRSSAQGYGAADGVRQKFTQKERDNETGLDYFLARYHSSTQGRFTSPDEFKGGPDELYVLGTGDQQKQALPYAEITQPGSLNKYSYSYNNPLRFVDPDGHCGTPLGLKPGQVGICVASYIRTKWFMKIGRGDGRDTNGQGGTSRVELRVVVDVKNGSVTKAGEALGTSGLVHKSLGFQASGGLQVSEANKDKQGNVYFQISQHGNSFMNKRNVLGTIDNHLNMVATPDNKVGITPSSTARDFPSLEVYKYTMDAKGNVTTTLVLAKTESDRSALKKPEQPVQADLH